MRHRIALALVVFFLLPVCMGTLRAGDKSKLQWFSFENGLVEARKTNKKVLVDVFTDWCGWCKKMDADTYSNPGIADYLQKKYVVVKLNAESSVKQAYKGKQYTERELASEFGVTGYPTTIFFTSDGIGITALPGYADATNFGTILSYIGDDHYLNTKFEDYERTKK
jgi:thioredoxin-related protein